MGRFVIIAGFVCIFFAAVSSQGDPCDATVDILVIADGSGNVGNGNFQKQLQFASTLVDNFRVGVTQFSLIRSDSNDVIMFGFHDYLDKSSLKAAILQTLYNGGGSSTAAHLKQQIETAFKTGSGVRPGVPRIAILIKDGMSDNPNVTKAETQMLKDSNILVLTIGVGAYYKPELDPFATYQDDIFKVSDYDTLVSSVRDYSQLVCDEVKLFDCHNDGDIYFLLDSSNTISMNSFSNARRFILNITSRFNHAEVSFGAATFGYSLKKLFTLGHLTDQSQIEQALQAATAVGGVTDLDWALKVIRDQKVFDPASGGRINATKILIILTDGGFLNLNQAKSTAAQLRATGVQIFTVGVSSANITDLQQLVTDPVLDVVANLAYPGVVVDRIDDFTAYPECKVPEHAVRDVSDACRSYNWADGIHQHPYDCTKFILCTALRTEVMPCPPNQGYDPFFQTCIVIGLAGACRKDSLANSTQPPLTRQVNSSTTDAPCVKGQLDILFILDSSDDIGSNEFDAELRFAANLAENFQIGPAHVQFAALSFGTNLVNLFNFSTFNDYIQIKTAILEAHFVGGITNTHLALEAGLNYFNPEHGSRPPSPKVAIVFTNGRSIDPVKTKQLADALKKAGVHVFTVGLERLNFTELLAIASDYDSTFGNDFNSVLAALQKFSNTHCNHEVVCNRDLPADVIFVLDSSNSISDPDYQNQLLFVANVTENFNLGSDAVRFGCVIFSSDTVKLFDLKDYDDHYSLSNAILSATHLKSGTDTARALNYVYDSNMYGTQSGGRVNATRVLIIMTDGRSNSLNDTVRASDRLKRISVKFIAIGIGVDIYLEELTRLAGDNGSLFTVADFSALEEIKDEVTIKACDLTTEPVVVPTKPAEVICDRDLPADVIFVLDSSNSISEPDYQSQLIFVANVTENFKLGPDAVRFGCVIFSTDTVKLFDLKDYSSHDALGAAILSAPHLKSGTDTARALNYVYDSDMYGTQSGGRVNATRVLIIMTDGRSNSLNDTVRAAARLKTIGVKFIVIGIGVDIYLEELTLVAGNNESLFTVVGYNALEEIRQQVTIKACDSSTDIVVAPTDPVVTALNPSNLCSNFRWADGRHPNPYDCTTYVICTSSSTTIVNCLLAEAYDPIMKKCTDKSVAHRCDDPTYLGPGVDSSLALAPAPKPSSFDITSLCANFKLVDGFYPDPGNCNHFVQCSSMMTYYMACASGLLYNTESQVCDTPQVVNCQINFSFFNKR